MKRLLIVGAEIPNFECIQWGEWSSYNALDYQGLVLDCRKLSEMPPAGILAASLASYISNGHPVYVILPEAKSLGGAPKAMSFYPGFQFNVISAQGKTLKIRQPDPLFQTYIESLDGHEIICQLLHMQQGTWMEGIVDNISRLVCGKYATIYLLHPPARKFEQRAFKAIIEHFGPDPVLAPTIARPSWVDGVASTLPGIAEIQTALTLIRNEIENKTTQLRQEEEKLRKLSSWVDLLWLEGTQLQTKVSEALNLLGVAASASDPSGHTCDLSANESNIHFVFEVTGSSGTIGIEKGRQLMQWVSDTPDPASTKGVLIANAFRNDPPDSRPPTPDRRIFVTELERLATRYHLALLDIRELYRAVSLKLSGLAIDKSAILGALSTDGVVRFPV